MILGCNNTFAVKPVDIYPQKAFTVLTEESWGCISNQRIVSDATDKVTSKDTSSVRVDEIKNSEDRENRNELYLYFPAQKINGLPGYFILRLGIKHQNPEQQGYLLVDQAKLIVKDNKHFIEVRASVDGLVNAAMFYSRYDHIQKGLFSCPEADVFEPFKTNFIRMHEIRHGLKFESRAEDTQWKSLSMEIPPALLAQAISLDACEELLDRLDKEFSSPEHIMFLWDKAMVTTKKIDPIVNALKQEKDLSYDLLIKINDKGKLEEINIGQQLFVPQVKQKISVKKNSGQIVGGEIWINRRQ